MATRITLFKLMVAFSVATAWKKNYDEPIGVQRGGGRLNPDPYCPRYILRRKTDQ